MDDDRRRAYRGIALFFLVVGGAVLVVAAAQAVLDFAFFRGDPARVALFLMAIGAALGWTVRERG